MANITAVQAIKKYFESGDSGRKVEMAEFKGLSTAERNELGAQCAEAMGDTLVAASPA